MDVWSFGSQRRRELERQDLLGSELQGTKLNYHELKSIIHHNSRVISQLDCACPGHLVLEGKKQRELIKTESGVTVIKHTSQKHNYP